MKKIYLTPQITVVHIQASQMIAQSLGFKNGTVTDENNVMTKDEGDWDDDLWDE